MAARIRQNIEQAKKGELHVTGNFGVVSCPGNGVGIERLIRVADSAMYPAKWKGTNRMYVAGDHPFQGMPSEEIIG